MERQARPISSIRCKLTLLRANNKWKKVKKGDLQTYSNTSYSFYNRLSTFCDLYSLNVSMGPAEDKELATGLHRVRDIYCKQCLTIVGWTYVSIGSWNSVDQQMTQRFFQIYFAKKLFKRELLFLANSDEIINLFLIINLGTCLSCKWEV